MAPPAPPVRIVLLRPRLPENVGAVARALKNFGLDDWAAVAPAPDPGGAARRVAVHAGDVLERLRVLPGLDEAVADCVWVVGTSSRATPGERRLAPDEVAREALARAGEGRRVALVFGDERSGLTAAELRRCHALSAIPTEAAQPSLNLAQAVLVYAYELRRAGPVASPPTPSVAGGATDAELRQVEAALRDALRGAGFLAGPERHAVRDLLAALMRARLSRREARIWLAALRTLGRQPVNAAGSGGLLEEA